MVFVARRAWQVGVLACVYGYQFAIFKDIFFQNFGAKGKQRLTDVIAGLSLPSLVELLEENTQVNLQALFLMGKKPRQVVQLCHVALLPEPEAEVHLGVELLGELVLRVEILKEGLDLVYVEALEEPRDDLGDGLSQEELGGALGIAGLKLCLRLVP